MSASKDYDFIEYDSSLSSCLETDLFDKFYYIEDTLKYNATSSSDSFLDAFRYVRSPYKAISSYYHVVSFNEMCKTAFPLMMLLERLLGENLFNSVARCFLCWKKQSFSSEIYFQTSRGIVDDSNLSSEDSVMCLDHQNPLIFKSITTIFTVAQKISESLLCNRPSMVKNMFMKWKTATNIIRKILRNVPGVFRIFAILGHDALWNIFSLYCKDQSNTLSSTRKNSVRESFSATKGAQFSKRIFKYYRRVLTVDQLFQLLKDCNVIPVVFGRRRLEHLITELIFINNKKETSFLSPKKLDNSTTLEDAKRILKGHQRIVSFSTFLKMYWKLMGELLGIGGINVCHFNAIRDIIYSADSNSVKLAKNLSNSNDWFKYVNSLNR